MNLTFYVFEESKPKKIEEQIAPSKWQEKLDWVNIRGRDQSEISKFVNEIPFLKKAEDYLIHPEYYSAPKTFDEFVAFNIILSNEKDIYSPVFITFLVFDKLVITVIPQTVDFHEGKSISDLTSKKFYNIRHYLFYLLTTDLLSKSLKNMGKARLLLNKLFSRLEKESNKVLSSEVMDCKRNIEQLADIIEDQYVGFNIILSVGEKIRHQEDLEELKEIIQNFKGLSQIMMRLEEKAESLRIQFMLYQQERTTRKINTLTIVQSIFVPLTFLAGVYGMNFKYMPELEWKYGYFITWGVFVLISGISFFLFKKKKWFN